MSGQMQKLVPILMAAWTLLESGAEGERHNVQSTCKSLEVNEGEKATLNCQFNEDIEQAKLDFQVMQYSLNSTIGRPVISCQWYMKKKRECSFADGFVFQKMASNHVEVGIPLVSMAYEGRYECYVLPLDLEYVRDCHLVVRGHNSYDGHPEITEKSSNTVIIGTVLVIVFIVICICRQRLCRKNQKCMQKLWRILDDLDLQEGN